MIIKPITPIGYKTSEAFVECADRSQSGLREVKVPIYPPSRGIELRAHRQKLGLGLRESAAILDLSMTQLSHLESGSGIPEDPEDWQRMMDALKIENPKPQGEHDGKEGEAAEDEGRGL